MSQERQIIKVDNDALEQLAIEALSVGDGNGNTIFIVINDEGFFIIYYNSYENPFYNGKKSQSSVGDTFYYSPFYTRKPDDRLKDIIDDAGTNICDEDFELSFNVDGITVIDFSSSSRKLKPLDSEISWVENDGSFNLEDLTTADITYIDGNP